MRIKCIFYLVCVVETRSSQHIPENVILIDKGALVMLHLKPCIQTAKTKFLLGRILNQSSARVFFITIIPLNWSSKTANILILYVVTSMCYAGKLSDYNILMTFFGAKDSSKL